MYVHSLHTYPIKSCSGLTHQSLQINHLGPEYDRAFMLVDEDGIFVTQRKYPIMAQIHVDVIGGELHCWFADKHLTTKLSDVSAEIVSTQVWKDSVDSLVFSDKTNAWFSSILGKSVRLVMQAKDARRLIDPEYDGANQTVGFADGFPFLLANMASAQFINEHLDAPIDMQRFRPNIVVAGVEKAFAEDDWHTLSINGIEFDVVKPCTRCVIPSLHLHSQERQNQITKTLKQYRKTKDGIVFGQNMIHRGQGEIRVGDEVKLLK